MDEEKRTDQRVIQASCSFDILRFQDTSLVEMSLCDPPYACFSCPPFTSWFLEPLYLVSQSSPRLYHTPAILGGLTKHLQLGRSCSSGRELGQKREKRSFLQVKTCACESLDWPLGLCFVVFLLLLYFWFFDVFASQHTATFDLRNGPTCRAFTRTWRSRARVAARGGFRGDYKK